MGEARRAVGETRQGKDGVCAMTESLGQSPTARAPPCPARAPPVLS